MAFWWSATPERHLILRECWDIRDGWPGAAGARPRGGCRRGVRGECSNAAIARLVRVVQLNAQLGCDVRRVHVPAEGPRRRPAAPPRSAAASLSTADSPGSRERRCRHSRPNPPGTPVGARWMQSELAPLDDCDREVSAGLASRRRGTSGPRSPSAPTAAAARSRRRVLRSRRRHPSAPAARRQDCAAG